MREIKLYQCDICGTQYADAAACKRCEYNHKTKLEIIEMQHLPYENNQKGYPVRIKVCAKGERGPVWYKLQ